MASVKVAVTASQKFFCAGHCFGPEEQIVVLEDTPDRSLASKLAELDAASRGRKLEMSGLDRAAPADMFRSSGVLTYRVVVDPPPAPPSIEEAKPDVLPAPALEVTDGPGEIPAPEGETPLAS